MSQAAPFAQTVDALGCVPLSWAGSTAQRPHANFGDALSPVLVAALTGMPLIRRPMESKVPRLAAVGTIGHSFRGGDVHYWGTGFSDRGPDGVPGGWQAPVATTNYRVHALRGPNSGALLAKAGIADPGVYGDPAFLLPRLYKRVPAKRWDLGVIIHSSEVAVRHPATEPDPAFVRYAIPEELRGAIRIINTLCEPTIGHMADKLDEILACRRILTTSLHGGVIAEAYGIPWLRFATECEGLTTLACDGDKLEARFRDAFLGIGCRALPVYGQKRSEPTAWATAIAAIDSAWQPQDWTGGDALLASLPYRGPAAVSACDDVFRGPEARALLDDFTSQQFFAHEAVGEAATRHTPGREPAAEKPRPAPVAANPTAGASAAAAAATVPAAVVPPGVRAALDGFRAACTNQGTIPLVWARTTAAAPHANLGDALSPLILSALTNLPVAHRNFATPTPRLVSIGSIAHHMSGGRAILWGTGMNAWANPADHTSAPFALPPDTEIIAAAVRGPQSGEALRKAGAWVSGVWGDPVWLLPKLHRAPEEKKWDLGVILHLSELDGNTPESQPRTEYVRYAIPEALRERVRIIPMWCGASAAGMRGRLDDILSCRRILSTSLHGLVIAETYGIPGLHFKPSGMGAVEADLSTPGQIDHRFRDFFLGIGVERLPILQQDRAKPTDWAAAMEAIDRTWRRKTWDHAAFVASLPIPVAPGWDDGKDPDRLWRKIPEIV